MAPSEEITDSTDWLNTSLSSFASVESALRCQVCKDFFDTPMITSCSHTFCSLCIRRCLSSEGKCPSCRTSDQASKLRANLAVQELVDAFQSARPQAMELAERDKSETAARNLQIKEEGQESRTRKRKWASTDLANGETVKQTRARQTRSASQREANTSLPPSQELIMVLDSDDEGDGEYRPGPQGPEDGLVACPMCNTRMRSELVWTHIESCTGEQEANTRSSRASTPSTQVTRRPFQQANSSSKQISHLNYNLLRDVQLKKKLQEIGIPAWGSRQLMIRRHTQWVDIFNANCDSARPRSNRELLRELDIWERTQGGNAPMQGQQGPTDVMRKDFDERGWQGKHRSQFDDLVANARAKVAKKEKEDVPRAEEPTSNGTDTAAAETEPSPTEATHTQQRQPVTELPSAAEAEYDPLNPALSILTTAAQDVHTRYASPPISCSQSHSLQINGISPSSPKPRGTTDSLPEKSTSQNNVKRIPMFQVPEDPVHDMDGLEGGASM